MLQIVLLLGGATARIGDPSGKSSEREMLGDETIDTNIQGIRENLERVTRGGASSPTRRLWTTATGTGG